MEEGRQCGGRNVFKNNNVKKKFVENQELEKLRKACEKIEVNKVVTFADFPLTRETLKGLRENKYLVPTEIQKESLHISLRGIDVLGTAEMGSGKTLAFIIPIFEILYRKGWMQTDGLGALVVTPTCELAYQIFETFRKVGRYHKFSVGLINGGNKFDYERKRVGSYNIVIGTPGHLLEHMDETPFFNYDNLQMLILDEADMCLNMGFQEQMNSVLENLPLSRQTLLFSATQTRSVHDLARLSLKDPMYVSAHEYAKHCTPEGFQQSYAVCELHEKLDTIWSFIQNHRQQKIMVIFGTCKQVRYHYVVFRHLLRDISLFAVYGGISKREIMATHDAFRKTQNGVLFATDVASRGLDSAEVNWVFQLDCPPDVNTYIHRVGRTARYHSGGESILLLLPSEEKSMVEQLRNNKIPIRKIRLNSKTICSPLKKIEALLAQKPKLRFYAQRTSLTYLKHVSNMRDKTVFNVNALDTDAYFRSLGMVVISKKFLKKMKTRLRKKTGKQKGETLTENSELQHVLKEYPSGSTNEVLEKNDNSGSSSAQLCFSNESGESEDDDLLEFKCEDQDLQDIPNVPVEPIEVKANLKVKSKVTAAKEILKKEINVIKETKFNKDGEAVVNQMKEKISGLAQEYESENVGGIGIEKAKTVLREEDKLELYREKTEAKCRKETSKHLRGDEYNAPHSKRKKIEETEYMEEQN